MAITTFNDDSLARGKVTHAEIEEVLSDLLTLVVEEGQSKRGNPTRTYVGFTRSDRLLEIGIEYSENENHVFHARKANAKTMKAYKKLITKK
jgi:uncharacterized DUF497 family protein